MKSNKMKKELVKIFHEREQNSQNILKKIPYLEKKKLINTYHQNHFNLCLYTLIFKSKMKLAYAHFILYSKLVRVNLIYIYLTA